MSRHLVTSNNHKCYFINICHPFRLTGYKTISTAKYVAYHVGRISKANFFHDIEFKYLLIMNLMINEKVSAILLSVWSRSLYYHHIVDLDVQSLHVSALT